MEALVIGEMKLSAGEAHHARDVLRLADGTGVEIFDDAGAVGAGRFVLGASGEVAVLVERIDADGADRHVRWTVAAAVPKGERADWMVEKLSELGTAAFIPLAAARSVVLPEGKNKRLRWERIAAESAKQSRRRGVMRIEELTPVGKVVGPLDRNREHGARRGWFLATEIAGIPIGEAIGNVFEGGHGEPIEAGSALEITLFVGPEGGWTPEEIVMFQSAGLTPVRLTPTVLRVETAAVAAAAVIACLATEKE